MTVVHLVPAMEQGGVESVVCDLNRAISEAGWKSVVVSAGGRLVDRIEAEGGRHFRLDVKSKNPLTCIPRALRLRGLLRKLAAEDGELVVCAHSRVPAWLFVLANRKLGLPWATYAHGANTVSRYSAVMTRGDLVFAPSKFLAGYLLENYPDSTLESRLRIVSPCVNLERFDPERLDMDFVAEIRRALGLAPGAHVAMSVGRITPLKGFDNVIRDFAASAREGSRLVIVGGADPRHAGHLAALKAQAAALGVSDRVVFAGAQTKMAEYLSVADEVVCGNMGKPESFGLAVAEALAMNKPVRLLRRFGGAAEILDAVAAQNAATSREAVRALYGFDAFSKRALSAYREVLTLTRMG